MPPEATLVRMAVAFLADEGHAVRREVAFLSCSVDLVFVDHGQNLVAVEFKRRNWRRAIQQARHCLIGADRAYISVPADKITPEVLDCATQARVGIFGFTLGKGGLSWQEELPARPSPELWPLGRKWLAEAFHRTPED